MKSHIQLLKKINGPARFLTLCVLSLLVFASFSYKKDDPKKGVRTIVIDAGHGGKDPGCNGVNCKEKDVSLAIALKLGKLIEENFKDVKVIYTRKTDVFVELEDRAEIANKNKADLFISIHCNAAGKPVMVKGKDGKLHTKTFKNSRGKLVVVETTNPEPFGSETYVMSPKNEEGKMKVAQRENSVILMEDDYKTKYQGFDPNSDESYIIMRNYTSAYIVQSATIALKIQEEYAKKAGRIDKGVHQQSIWVLWRTAMPSVLTEVGYLTNPIEEKFLGSDKGQGYMATAIFRAFRKYKDDIEGTKKNYDDEFENQEALKNENTLRAQDSLKKVLHKNDPAEVIEAKKPDEIDEVAKKDSADIAAREAETKAADKKKADEAAEKARAAKLDKYKKLMTEGDEKLGQKKYPEAIALYQEAGTYKPEGDNSAAVKAGEANALMASAKKKADEEAEKARRQQEADEVRIAAEKEKENNAKEPNSQDIAKAFKDKAKKDSAAVKPSDKPIDKTAVVFKVQFASSDKEVDAKAKFAKVDDVSFYKMGVVYKYTSGHYTKIDEAARQQTKLREMGYADCFVVAFKNDKRIDINEAKKLATGP